MLTVEKLVRTPPSCSLKSRRLTTTAPRSSQLSSYTAAVRGPPSCARVTERPSAREKVVPASIRTMIADSGLTRLRIALSSPPASKLTNSKKHSGRRQRSANGSRTGASLARPLAASVPVERTLRSKPTRPGPGGPRVARDSANEATRPMGQKCSFVLSSAQDSAQYSHGDFGPSIWMLSTSPVSPYAGRTVGRFLSRRVHLWQVPLQRCSSAEPARTIARIPARP